MQISGRAFCNHSRVRHNFSTFDAKFPLFLLIIIDLTSLHYQTLYCCKSSKWRSTALWSLSVRSCFYPFIRGGGTGGGSGKLVKCGREGNRLTLRVKINSVLFLFFFFWQFWLPAWLVLIVLEKEGGNVWSPPDSQRSGPSNLTLFPIPDYIRKPECTLGMPIRNPSSRTKKGMNIGNAL